MDACPTRCRRRQTRSLGDSVTLVGYGSFGRGSNMKSWLWVVVAVLGFGMMWTAYFGRPQLDSRVPWGRGLIALGPALKLGTAAPGPLIPVHLKHLQAPGLTETIFRAIEQTSPEAARKLDPQIRPSLIELPLDEAGITPASLGSGRLPVLGADEIIAGPNVTAMRDVLIGDRKLVVVGQLKSDFVLFSRSYLMPRSRLASEVMPESDTSVESATLVQLSAGDRRSSKVLEQLKTVFPAAEYTVLEPEEHLAPQTYYRYLAGLAVLLLGGSGALIGVYRWLATRIPVPWLAAPLLEIRNRPGLIWGVHVGYFGLVIVCAIWMYEFWDFQALLLSVVRTGLTAKSGPMAAVGAAYGSGNVLRAAALTFVVNFFLGSLLMITVPAMIVPGGGMLIPIVRSALWGLLFAPTFATLALGLLPHSGTMLLEGAGYIMATFFGLLIPIHACQPKLGGDFFSRYGRALLLNLQGNVWVVAVLVVSALYEAVEVIAMKG
jgi:hypothetical protein